MNPLTTEQESRRIHHREIDVMGTVVTIDLFGRGRLSPARVRSCVNKAELILREADRVFSTWKPESPLSRLRRGQLTIGEAPPEVAEVLDACLRARRATYGWFDPWSMPEGIDPTGFVKGWAAQRALEPLRELGLVGALVNAAGDVASFGGPTKDERFRIGIVNPAARTQLACIVASPGAVATSGTYERGNHLINPFTGAAVATPSATVTGPDLGFADALATALALAGSSGLEFINSLEEYEGLVIDGTGAIHSSESFPMAQNVPG